MPRKRKLNIKRYVTKRTPLWVVIIILILLLALQYGQFGSEEKSAEQPTAGFHRVIQVVDGDTIAVDIVGKEEKIRLIGVDTPEVKDPRKPVQCFGQAASDFTKRLVENNNVRLEKDGQSSNRDRYNRLLRYVYLPDGRLVNAEIIRQGYGYAYTQFDFTKMAEFEAYEQEARRAKRGLWGECEPQADSAGNGLLSGKQAAIMLPTPLRPAH